MSVLQHLSTTLTNPALLKPHKRIFLLSHMRANTSVLGHIIGSNPAIAGYYEMHIGYYSWKSLLHQKLLYYQVHDYKPGTRFLFDKVLHTYHRVDPALLNKKNVTSLITIREPEQTIRSIVNLFRSNFKTHEYQSVDEATRYYCDRVTYLAEISSQIDCYYFFNAVKLKTDTEQFLNTLSRWLQLETPLSQEYNQFELTGKNDSGDKTAALKTGRLQSGSSDYSNISLLPEQLEQAMQAYLRAFEKLQNNATENIC